MPTDLIDSRALVLMVVVAVVSVVAGSFIAAGGGWRAAANRFPAPAHPPRNTEWFRSGSLRMTGGWIGTAACKSIAIVGLSDRGISLSLWAPFRLFHPPLLIPWRAVERCEARPTPWGDSGDPARWRRIPGLRPRRRPAGLPLGASYGTRDTVLTNAGRRSAASLLAARGR